MRLHPRAIGGEEPAPVLTEAGGGGGKSRSAGKTEGSPLEIPEIRSHADEVTGCSSRQARDRHAIELEELGAEAE